ncbi:MAG TPA: DUF362 domain-containing protein [Spirochaetia bacterium]|nr:DUF362 domain-containing protein [Spirochaetales bacterium]HRY82010.1 DUF362 domain-containing protein [Spirochaetia bacterium]HRZ88333.1 DUF362 domain-containing protein [Spirochaetia bacterium]
MTPVSLVACASYDPAALRAAAARAFDLADGPDPSGKTVLLKPNLLSASHPDKAVTTHPEVLRAAIRLFRERGAARILVGESPGWQSASLVAGRTGVRAVVEEEGVEWADFSESAVMEVPEGRVVKRFDAARAALDADILVSLPKLKTHKLLYFTGAAKNLFGIVPGLGKSRYHLRFPERREFGAMITDLVLAAKPAFSLMDAVVGMEGPGPGNGTPRPLGWLLASRDCLALDWTASGLIGYEPGDIPYLADARDRGILVPRDIEVRGLDPGRERVTDYKRIHVPHDTDFFRARLPGFVHRIARNLAVERPAFSDRRCVACAGCVKICPAGALAFREGKRAPVIDYAACIRCYCCHEICPADAIRLIRRPW